MSDIDLVKKVRVYAEEAEKNGFDVLTVPLRDLFPLLGRMEAAERERDELRAEQAEHDEQIARMESKFSLAKRALDSKTARCEKAEAELRRRDTAAGEVSCQHKWMNSQGRTESGWLCEKCGDYERPIAAQPAVLPHEGVSKALRDCDWSGVSIGKKAVICAAIDALGARPAVLPPAMTYAEALKICDWKNDQASIWVEGANWMRKQCLELGAQQQNFVEMPDRKFRECVNGLLEEAIAYAGTQQLRARLSTRLLNFVKPQHMDNVKWEVSK